MLEMREREGSGVLGAREDPGRRGREVSKYSVEIDASQERQCGLTPFSRSRYTASDALTRALGRRRALAEYRSMREWPPRSCARERERWDTGGLTANNEHTCGFEGLSGPRRGRVPQMRRQNSFQRKTVVNRRFTRSGQCSFTKRAGCVLTSPAGGDSRDLCSTAQ